MRTIGTTYDIIENANAEGTGLVNENEYNVQVIDIMFMPESDSSNVSINLKKYKLTLASPFVCHLGQKLVFEYVGKSIPGNLYGNDVIELQKAMSVNPTVTVVSITNDTIITVQTETTLISNQNVILHSNFSINFGLPINKKFPTNIFISNVKQSSVDINFDKVAGAIKYIIAYRKINDNNTSFTYIESENNVYTLSGLLSTEQIVYDEPNLIPQYRSIDTKLEYEVKIQSVFENDRSLYSQEKRFTL